MFSMHVRGSGDGPPDRPAKHKRKNELGHRIPTEQKRELYNLCKTSWADMKPGQRVLEFQRVVAEKPVRQALLTWLRDYGERRQTAQPIEDPEAIVGSALRKAKNAVAAGRPIEEAVSHWTADAVFKLKPPQTFARLKFEISKIVRAALG